VLIHKGFRFRVYPSTKQAVRLGAWEDSLRFLWNLAHEQRLMGLSRCGNDKRYPKAFDQINQLTELRAWLPWLTDVPRNVCAQFLIELDKAWQKCFGRMARAPRFKRKGRDPVGICDPHHKTFRVDGLTLHFPKLGPMRVVIHRPLEGKPKTCTLKRDGDQWFASIVCEIEIADPVPRTEPTVAIDRGVVNVVADSDGVLIPNPKHYAAAQRQLARAQRNAARKKKGSKNKAKANAHVARIHRKVRRQREHFLHEISARYSKSHATIVVEKLQIRNMTRGASGTVEEPGVNVAQKRGLNRSIVTAGWGKLVEQLKYKTAWLGGRVVEVPAAYSSQTCSACGHVDAESRTSQATFSCTGCGFTENADINAAIVLKARANRSCQLGEASSSDSPRPKKRLRVARRKVENSAVGQG
jgi:putative transposase